MNGSRGGSEWSPRPTWGARRAGLVGSLFFAALLGTALAGRAYAEDEKETYQERHEFDPKTGQWIEIAPPIPGTEEGDLALSRSLLARGKYSNARKAFKQWFETWPESTRRPEALFYAAETEVSAEDEKPRGGDLIKAYEWLKELQEGWPGDELAERGLRKQLIIAEMILFKGRKQKVWKGFLWLSADDEALMMLDRIIDEWARDTPIAEQALRIKADYHYVSGEFEEAEQAYARLVRDFGRGRYHKFALLRCGEAALSRFPGVEFDDADLLEAEVYLHDYQQQYPADAAAEMVPQLLSRVAESRAEKDYKIGQYYERTRQVNAAAYYYRFVMNNYSATTWALQARNRLIAIGGMEAPPEELEPSSQPVAGTETAED